MSQDNSAFLKLMNRDSGRVSIDEDRIRQAREIQREIGDRRMKEKEKNPKQVLIDWVKNVNYAATCGKNALHANNGLSKEKKFDVASGQFERILGQCEAMMTVLNNSD